MNCESRYWPAGQAKTFTVLHPDGSYALSGYTMDGRSVPDSLYLNSGDQVSVTPETVVNGVIISFRVQIQRRQIGLRANQLNDIPFKETD